MYFQNINVKGNEAQEASKPYDQLDDRRIDDISNILFLFLYFIKQVDSMLPCVCSVKDQR